MEAQRIHVQIDEMDNVRHDERLVLIVVVEALKIHDTRIIQHSQQLVRIGSLLLNPTTSIRFISYISKQINCSDCACDNQANIYTFPCMKAVD